ncbi:MAG: DUF167 domain-containing protein [Planctomycetota bacterium]
MLDLRDSGNGIIIKLRVAPGARKNAVTGSIGGRLKICVCAPPEAGKANKAAIELVAKTLKVRRSQITLVTGETNRNKSFRVTGLTREEVETRLYGIAR